jgi:exonuclease SbcD
LIKIIHFSDLHFGANSYGRIDPATGLSARHADFSKSLDRVIDTAIEGEADLLIFSGDAYKTRRPSPAYQCQFAKRIMRLSAAGITTVLLTGNHDIHGGAGQAHTMEIFETLEVPRVYVASKPTVLDIETRNGPVQVGALPWLTSHNLLTHTKYRNKSQEEIGQILLAAVETIVSGEGGLVSRLRPGVPHILVSHGSVQGAVYGSERSVMLGSDITLPLGLFKNDSWDYVALGHIHRHQGLEDERFPPVVYSGSIERIDFGEEREDKGFVTAQVGVGECAWEFHKLDTRRFVTIRVEADGVNPMSHVLRAIEQAEIQGAVVRVIIDVTEDRNALIGQNGINRALKGAFHIASITRNITRPERMRVVDQQQLLGMSPVEALRMYLGTKQTDPERIELLAQCAKDMNIGEYAQPGAAR